ncbi:hypothetical protein SAMN05421863_102655 [Nitrosomonas communis]|uniref:Uncharacterized protein n=1 Tax=Nitrosomonas communis TaxID=44574 RepID=A0A1I4QHC7_9PROT|nr:hypothetical protein SAMN05421863_102655 [Nitrosomonas communis]
MAGRHYTLAKLAKQDGYMDHSFFRYQDIKIFFPVCNNISEFSHTKENLKEQIKCCINQYILEIKYERNLDIIYY